MAYLALSPFRGEELADSGAVVQLIKRVKKARSPPDLDTLALSNTMAYRCP